MGNKKNKKPAKRRSRPPIRQRESDLPFLMAPPDIEATRIFTFAIPNKSGILVIEAYFRMPQGLYRLQGSESNRSAYKSWAKDICREMSSSLPERVHVASSMCQRKIWEIGRAVKDGHVGPEVDMSLAERLNASRLAPPHPAMQLDLKGVTAMTIDELGESNRYLSPFHHSSAQRALREQWEQHGGSVFWGTQSSATGERLAHMAGAAADLANQWGIDNIVELLLDLALIYATLGKRSVAKSFWEVAMTSKDDLKKTVVQFLTDYVVWSMSR